LLAQVRDRGGSGAPWQQLGMTREGPPLLFAGGIDGTVSLFDLRARGDQAAARAHLHDGPLVRCCSGLFKGFHLGSRRLWGRPRVM